MNWLNGMLNQFCRCRSLGVNEHPKAHEGDNMKKLNWFGKKFILEIIGLVSIQK